jgi:predicted dehydrogenase
MGTGDARNSKRYANLVAVCDVDKSHIEKAVKSLSDPGQKIDTYTDFRKLLERKDIDAIINGTPDHWLSLINIGAAKAGKDIYSEKPLTLTIDEGKHVVRAVRDNKVILQTGTQQRSNQRFPWTSADTFRRSMSKHAEPLTPPFAHAPARRR